MWFERDEFWKVMAPVMFKEVVWEAANLEVQKIEELVDLEAGARVLDLPCGPGRHAIALARRGFELRHRLYSGEKLRQLLVDAGFADVEIYGDFEGGDYDQDASRLVAVARKGGA